MHRREFVKTMAGAAAGLPAGDGWSEAEAIVKRIHPPTFPERDFDLTRYGARADSATDCSEAFRRAIAACHEAGGGRVVVPAGSFLSGAIHLKSNVNLHLAASAVIRFSQDPRQYLPLVFTRWEGVECMNYSPFIYAVGAENIAITGSGVLDGQADCRHWWPWKGRTDCGWKKGEPSQQAARDRLVEMGEKDVPVAQRTFGEGSYLRPNFVQPCRSKNVLIEGVTIRNSPMWEIHPLLSENVTVRNVTVSSHGPNNDGCDPESCTDVLIEGCRFDTGDDCIAIKSGRNRDGRRAAAPARNIVIRGCQMKDGHGGVTVGSEVSGDVRWVFAEDCVMDSPNLDRVLRLKTNSVRGGVIEHVYMRNVTVGQVADAAVHIDFFYEEGEGGAYLPTVRDIHVSNLTSKKSKYALYLRGFANAPIQRVRIEHCNFENVAKPNVTENVKELSLVDVKINGRATQEGDKK